MPFPYLINFTDFVKVGPLSMTMHYSFTLWLLSADGMRLCDLRLIAKAWISTSTSRWQYMMTKTAWKASYKDLLESPNVSLPVYLNNPCCFLHLPQHQSPFQHLNPCRANQPIFHKRSVKEELTRVCASIEVQCFLSVSSDHYAQWWVLFKHLLPLPLWCILMSL